MKANHLSRREMLKLSSLSFGALAFQPLSALLPPEDHSEPIGVGRVTISKIGVYKEPSLDSEKREQRFRDDIIRLYEEIISPHGPPLNPKWYRVVGGYVHSAYIQRVEKAALNEPLLYVTRAGRLGEVTVPYTQSLIKQNSEWAPFYRLYFQSVHWITGVSIGSDGESWYQLTDELLRINYNIPAKHVRPITQEELSPISPDVPPEKKLVEVSLIDQTMTAYENGEVVLHRKVSTGLPEYGETSGLSTITPRGDYNIDPKVPSKHMGDGRMTSEIDAYELPGVPWVSFFVHNIGVAFHGTYWHDNFGARMSHGCVNMRCEDAKWLYRWSTPQASSKEWTIKGMGTRVKVY